MYECGNATQGYIYIPIGKRHFLGSLGGPYLDSLMIAKVTDTNGGRRANERGEKESRNLSDTMAPLNNKTQTWRPSSRRCRATAAGESVEGVARAAVGKNEGARVADLQVRAHSVVLTFEIGVTVHETAIGGVSTKG